MLAGVDHVVAVADVSAVVVVVVVAVVIVVDFAVVAAGVVAVAAVGVVVDPVVVAAVAVAADGVVVADEPQQLDVGHGQRQPTIDADVHLEDRSPDPGRRGQQPNTCSKAFHGHSRVVAAAEALRHEAA